MGKEEMKEWEKAKPESYNPYFGQIDPNESCFHLEKLMLIKNIFGL